MSKKNINLKNKNNQNHKNDNNINNINNHGNNDNSQNDNNQNVDNIKNDNVDNIKNDNVDNINIEKRYCIKIDELTNDLKRLQAEFDNYRKRVESEKNQLMDFASKNLILKLLPTIDNFELALKNSSNHQELLKGIEMIYAQLIQVLNEEGVKIIETKNKFDPYFHEALIAEESDKSQGTILEVFQKGYLLKDKVLRHSKVKVSK